MMIDFKALQESVEKDKTTTYCIVSGDKSFIEQKFLFLPVGDVVTAVSAKDVLFRACDILLKNQVGMGRSIVIMTSDNNGVDSMAVSYSTERNYDCIIVPTDWDGLGKRAGYLKNEEIMYQAGRRRHKAAILFWDGEDVMTRNLMYQAFCMGVPCRVYNYVDKKWLTQPEISDIQKDERYKALNWRKNKDDGGVQELPNTDSPDAVSDAN